MVGPATLITLPDKFPVTDSLSLAGVPNQLDRDRHDRDRKPIDQPTMIMVLHTVIDHLIDRREGEREVYYKKG